MAKQEEGLSYHWLLELFVRLKLPVFDGMAEGLQKGNEIRAKNLEKKQTEEAKQQHTNWKKARVHEQEERKQWIYRQKILHTYGSDNDDDDDQLSDDDGSDATLNEGTATSTNTSEKNKCKCGSTSHKCISHRECPLNKNKRQIHDSDEMDDVDDITSTDKELAEIFCTCKSQWGTHSRSCPLNPRNITRC